MTDRINALTVVLDADTREDDAAAILAAIRQIRGVLTVTPRPVDISDYIAESRARIRLQSALVRVLRETE